MEQDVTLEEHIANAAHPRGDYGARLMKRMNAGEHERLSTWAFLHLERVTAKEGALALPDCAAMLDIGCGGGANLRRLLELRPHGHVSGIDHADVSVATSLETCTDLVSAGSCDVRVADVAALPFESNAFDLATAFETTYFWPDLASGLAEAHRVLAPGGMILICNETGGASELPEWTRGLRVLDAEGFRRALSASGFERTSIDTTDEGWICAIAEKPTA